MANEIEIVIGERESIKSTIIDSKEFLDIKNNLEEDKSIQTKKSGVSRIWKDKFGYYYIEFYNKIAFKFNTKEELEKIKNVEFLRVPYISRRNKISYISKIDKAEFDKFKESEIKQIDIPELSFFGKFHQLRNSDVVLVQWSKQFSKNEFSIIENIYTMIGVDWELSNYLFNKKNIRETVIQTIESCKKIEFQFTNGFHTNKEDFRKELAKVLNINLNSLDFSIESLNQIEISLMWNADNLNTNNLVLPFTSYIGEILIREKSIKWLKQDEYKYPLLINDDNKPYDLFNQLYAGLVDTDYGLPQVGWVFETALKELK